MKYFVKALLNAVLINHIRIVLLYHYQSNDYQTPQKRRPTSFLLTSQKRYHRIDATNTEALCYTIYAPLPKRWETDTEIFTQ